jgi:hypothetical protein
MSPSTIQSLGLHSRTKFCGSGSLHNWISATIGINSLGLPAYFKRLFNVLGIQMTPNVVHFLEVKEKGRSKQLEKLKTKEQEKVWMAKKLERLQEDETIAKPNELHVRATRRRVE